MLALVVTVCLNTDMTRCGDQVVAWLPYDNASLCVLDSRPRIAAWARENTEMTVSGVRCLPGRGGSPSVYRAALHPDSAAN
jgi:hypothetical protein